MMFLYILKILFAVLTIITGLYSLVKPKDIKGFTGLVVDGPRGITEIRSIMGGVFIALGALPLILGEDIAYFVLGATYLVIGAVRLVSMLVDKSVERSNLISLAVEVVFGIILVI